MIRDKYISNIVSEISLIKGSFSGSTIGGTPEWTTSEKGHCLKMDGSTDYLDIGNTTKSVKSATFVVQPDSITSHTDYVIDLNGTDYITIVNGTVTVNGFAGATTNVFINGIDVSVISDISKLQHITVVSNTAFAASDVDICRLEGAGFFGGKISYVILFDNELSAEDCAKYFEDWQRLVPYTAVDFKSEARYINAIADGMMKKTGTDDFIVDGVGGVLSKVADPERGQVLAVYSGAGNITYAYQYNLEVGYYRLRGWLKGDATNGGIARIKVGGVWMTGSNATDDWQMIDEVVYNPSAANVPFKMGQTAATTSYSYYSDIECIKLNSANENDFASPQGYIADGKGWNESVQNETSSQLSNTGWQVSTGTWQVDDVDGFNKEINCIAAGILTRPSSQVYGSFQTDFTLGTSTDTINWDFVWNGTTGYRLEIGNDVYKITEIGVGDVVTGTWTSDTDEHTALVTRATDGTFTLYLDGTSTGTPAADTTTTTCTQQRIDADTGDKIRNFKFIPYIQ